MKREFQLIGPRMPGDLDGSQGDTQEMFDEFHGRLVCVMECVLNVIGRIIWRREKARPAPLG